MLAVERGLLLGEHPLDNLARLVERAQPPAQGFEIDAETSMLQLVPSGAEAKVETSAAYVIERRGHLRGQAWIAIGVAVDHRAQPRAFSVLAERAEQRPVFHARTGGIGRENRIEVIEGPDRVVAPSVGVAPEIAHPLPSDILL